MIDIVAVFLLSVVIYISRLFNVHEEKEVGLPESRMKREEEGRKLRSNKDLFALWSRTDIFSHEASARTYS